MIEGFAREMPESLMAEAIAKAHEYVREICDLQIELAQKVNVSQGVRIRRRSRIRSSRSIRGKYFEELKQAKRTEGKQARAEAVKALKERVKADLLPDSGRTTRRRSSQEKVLRSVAIVGNRSGPRADPRRHAARRPRRQDAAGDRLRGRRVAPRSRLGRLPARRNAGPGHGHARHRQGRAARRRADRRIHPEVHAALLLPVVFGGRSAAHPRPRPPRNRPRRAGRAKRQAGAARRRRFSLYDPHHLRHSGIQRLQLDGHGLRLDAGPDGRGRADQQSGRRHLHRPGQGDRPLDAC